jgi:DNA polymerase III alpha subunit (gram-positive type)
MFNLDHVLSRGRDLYRKPFPPENYIILDIATAGLFPMGHGVQQVAIGMVGNKHLNEKTYTKYIKPYKDISCTSESVRVNGITELMLRQQGGSPESVFKFITLTLQTAPAIVVFNSEFLLKFLRTNFVEFKIPFPDISNKIIDVGAIIKASQLNEDKFYSAKTLLKYWQEIHFVPSAVHWGFDFVADSFGITRKEHYRKPEENVQLIYQMMEKLRDLAGCSENLNVPADSFDLTAS